MVLVWVLLSGCQSNSSSVEWDDIPSAYVELKDGEKLHYKMQGSGDPILFIHGNFTNSYLWRNVLPALSKKGTCYAIDLMGMGKSDKPYIDYTIREHAVYIDSFISKMKLNNITLVGHEWGGSFALHYASIAQHKVKAVALIEPIIGGASQSQIDNHPSTLVQAYGQIRNDENRIYKVLNENAAFEKLLRLTTLKPLDELAYTEYSKYYPEPIQRRPMLKFLTAFPINGKPATSSSFIALFKGTFIKFNIPKLLITSTNGIYVSKEGVIPLKEAVVNLKVENVGDAGLLIPEDQPEATLQALETWFDQEVLEKN